MAYTKFSGTYRSSNHKNRIYYYIFEPEADIRAVLQITHGWKDYIERNENLIQFFTDHGVMVCGCDFIGHGRSSEVDERGHFEERDGWIYLVKDVKRLTAYVRREYPGIPCFLYGHGMGSLVARLCCLHHPAWDGVILSGTSGRQKYCRRAIAMTSLMRRLPHQEKWSLLLEKMIYHRLNRRFRGEGDELSWFSGELEAREKYETDERTRFHFTLNAYENIFKMLALTSAKKWYQSMEPDLPILLLSGKDDPIGNFGKGISQVEDGLRKEGCTVQTRLYEGFRHELQGDSSFEQVFGDVLEWMQAYVTEPSDVTIIY